MTDHIERELELPASAVELWEALTDPEWLSSWLADEVTIDLLPGGDASFRFGDEVKTGWVEEVSAPERLAFWWASDGEPASRVELTITPLEDGQGSRLRVTETRPLDRLDLVGIPLRWHGGATYGPALIAA